MRYVGYVGKGFQHSSGRVIALGRLMLATLFLLAVWMDASQPTHAPTTTYQLIAAYIAFAAIVTFSTWNNWWLDAKLAGPAHAVDIAMFSLLVLLTEGYTSPFFTFFMFILLSAAIRWSWHATALTAMLLTLLYLVVGMLVMEAGVSFEPQRFMVRTGQLVIVSLILIWFGTNQRWARFDFAEREPLAQPALDESPLEAGLRAAMTSLRANAGVFIWRDQGRVTYSGIAIRAGGVTEVELPVEAVAKAIETTPFLYDVRRNRGLHRDADRNLVHILPAETIGPQASSALALTEGLAVPVRSDRGEGLLFLDRVRGLSTDHIAVGDQLASEVAAHIQRHALLHAAEESAEARSRLTLARDLHDSVVQFLAGAAFRLEAMKRSSASGRDVDEELNELKQLMLQEQRELRSFITSLRSGPLAAFNDLARDLQTLAVHLSRQWDVHCEFSAHPADMMIPTRLRLDAHQLMREAVANAVRHASAKSITVGLAALSDQIKLEFINDGAEFRPRGGRLEMPASLKERVEQAGGALDMARGMGVTKLSITLPIGEMSH
jgi:signal transduction histidine kinase